MARSKQKNEEFGEREELKQINPSKRYKTTRVFISPNGPQTDQLQEITNKTTPWAGKILAGHLPAQEAWKCLSSTFIKNWITPYRN